MELRRDFTFVLCLLLINEIQTLGYDNVADEGTNAGST